MPGPKAPFSRLQGIARDIISSLADEASCQGCQAQARLERTTPPSIFSSPLLPPLLIFHLHLFHTFSSWHAGGSTTHSSPSLRTTPCLWESGRAAGLWLHSDHGAD